MPNLGTLTLDLIAKVGGFTGPLDKAGRHHKKTARQIQREQEKMRDAFNQSMRSIGKWGAAMVTAAYTGAVAMTKKSFAAADAIGKISAAAGVTTDSLQELRYAAQISGMSVEELDQGIMGFGKRVGELRAGTGSLYTMLDKTNKALLSQIKEAPSVNAALDLIMGAMAGTADDADRAALAVAAFGRSGQKMSILSQDYKALRSEAQALGLIIDERLIRSAEETNDQMTALSMIVKTQLMAGILELAPYIQEVVGEMTDWIKNNKAFLSQDIPSYIKSLAQEVRDFVKSPAFDAFKEYWEIIAGAAVGFAAGGPFGALFGAGAGAGVSIYRDLGDFFDKSVTEKIRELRAELTELGSTLQANPGSRMIARAAQLRTADIMEELKGYLQIESAQKEVLAQTREKAKAERDAAEAVKMQAAAYARLSANLKEMKGILLDFEVARLQSEISDTEILTGAKIPFQSGVREAAKIELAAKKEYLQQLLALQGRETEQRVKQNAEIIALDQKVQSQLEIIGLDGYDRQLRILEQKQAKELEQYRKAGADILALEKLHVEQRNALKSANAKELLGEFTSAPDFAGTGGESGELGMLAQQEANLQEWYNKQFDLLDAARAKRADLNETWNQKELEIAKEHQDRLAMIEQARSKIMLDNASLIFGDLAEIQKSFSDDQDSTYKKLFMISKAFTIASATLNMAKAVSDVMATEATFGQKLGAAAIVTSSMLAIIQSAQAVGMAHDGIDSVPETGTWLLQKGERVIAERTSKRLDDTLSRLQGGNWNVNIHEAPGTAAQVIRRADGIEVQIALIEEKLTERMSRGTGMAGALDRRYGRRG